METGHEMEVSTVSRTREEREEKSPKWLSSLTICSPYSQIHTRRIHERASIEERVSRPQHQHLRKKKYACVLLLEQSKLAPSVVRLFFKTKGTFFFPIAF